MPRRSSLHEPSHPRYSIVRRLGSGGVGSVYLARDLLADGHEVALKVSHREIVPEEILREFRILRELRHLGIARAYDFGRLPSGGQTYFTMEYVDGPNLEKESVSLRRSARRENFDSLLDVYLQITRALHYVHRKGLLHLDLKPSNVVFADGRIKLIDFGLFQNVHLQDSGRARGTAHYTAPEVLDGGTVDSRADLYSLGVTLYRSSTGRYPFTGRSFAEIANHHRKTTPRPPPGVPEEFSRIIMKLLAKSPRHRFQTASDVESALEALLPQSVETAKFFPFREPDFVGRKAELSTFFSWLDGVGNGQGSRTLLVEGQPGAGKSRFVDACVTEMLGLGVQVVTLPGHTIKQGDGLRRIIERLITLSGLSSELKTRYRFLLTSVGISSHKASRREISQMDLDQIRARVFRAALELLNSVSREPLVLILEDIHRADAQLRDFVRRFTENGPPTRPEKLGLIVTRRSGIPSETDQTIGGALAIPLGRLKREDIIESLRGAMPLLGSRKLSRLATSSGGNPGLLVRLLYQTVERDGTEVPRVSTDLSKFLRQQLRAYKKPERSLILFLGLLNHPASEALLRDLTGLSRAAFRAARQNLLNAGLMEADHSGFFRAQDILQESTASVFDEETIREARERLGLRLLKNRRRLGEAALHLFGGGRIDEGLASAKKAARELRDVGRVEDAIALYREALKHATDTEDRVSFVEGLADLQDKSGQFDEAEKGYASVIEEASLPAVSRLRVTRKLGGVYQRSGNNEAALQTFEDALQLLDSADELEEHLHLMNELAAFYLFRGEFSQSTTFAKRGLELLRSREAAQLSPESSALHNLNLRSVAGHILLRQFEHDRAAEEFLESLKISERIGTLSNTALILNNLGVAYYQGNRLKEALHVYKKATDLAQKMGDETAIFSIQCNVAGIRARLGEIQAAREILDAVEEMPHPMRSKRARLFFLHTKSLVKRIVLEDARPLWQESIRLADELPDPVIALYGRVYLLENEIFQGRWEEARKFLRELDEIVDKDIRLERAVDMRRAYLDSLCGRPGRAEPSSQARGAKRSRANDPESRDCSDVWDRVLAGYTRMELGMHGEADSWLETARAIFVRLDQHPGTLECCLLLAEVGLRRRDQGRASKWLREARKALSLHDTSSGSRAACVRMPLLEARLGMLSQRTNDTYISDRLVDAAGNLPIGTRSETVPARRNATAEDVPGPLRSGAVGGGSQEVPCS